MRLLIAVLLLTLATASYAQQPPDPAFLQRALNSL